MSNEHRHDRVGKRNLMTDADGEQGFKAGSLTLNLGSRDEARDPKLPPVLMIEGVSLSQS